jgi:hypothetical protein
MKFQLMSESTFCLLMAQLEKGGPNAATEENIKFSNNNI